MTTTNHSKGISHVVNIGWICDQCGFSDPSIDLVELHLKGKSCQKLTPHTDDTTFADFDNFFDEFINDCKKMRDTKGKEYAHSTSRFANFNRASERLGITREMVANVYLHKHLDAIDSFILHKEEYSGENIRGRLIDAVTYMILIAGMIEMK